VSRSRRQTTGVIGAAVTVAAGGLMTNVVSDVLPSWLDDPLVNYLVLAVPVLLAMQLPPTITPAPEAITSLTDSRQSVPTPDSLRVPALDSPTRGRAADLARLASCLVRQTMVATASRHNKATRISTRRT